MNGGHDLGGMHGFGPIDPEPEAAESVFHADWEKHVFGMVRAVGFLGRWNGDMSRHARERQHPVDYLKHSYYENWLAGLEMLLVETGLVTAAELASGTASQPAAAEVRRRLMKAEEVAGILIRGEPVTMPLDTPPRFQPGDLVRAVNRHPTGHTREPRYVRGRVGMIHLHHGAHCFPDQSAQGVRGASHVYCVLFEAADLWGENADPNSVVFVDLWEDYLEPA